MKKISPKIKVALIASLPIIILLCAISIVYESEHSLNGNITIWETVENLFIVLMGEYPDKPSTPPARITQLILLAFSTVIVATIVGRISAFFVSNSLKGKKRKMLKNHIIICNWNDKANGIIDELLNANDNLDILVACSSEIDEAIINKYKNSVEFRQCDPTHHDVLKDLNTQQAQSIILLADNKTESPDDKNTLIALAIKHLEENTQRDVHVVAELTNLDRKRHLHEAGADEVICSVDYASGIIAQSSLHKGMSIVYDKLLSYSDSTNEIYFIEGYRASDSDSKEKTAKYPSHFIGNSFADLISIVNGMFETRNTPVLLIGIKRMIANSDGICEDKIMLNPKKNDFTKLEQGDDLIIMAFENVDMLK